MTQARVLTEDYLPTLIRLLCVLRIQDTDNAVIRQYSSIPLSLAAWQTPLTTLILEEVSRDMNMMKAKRGHTSHAAAQAHHELTVYQTS
jgi:hypothetical protein